MEFAQILSFGLLFANLAVVHGKGGGKTTNSNGGSSNKNKGSSSGSVPPIIIVNSGGTTVCYDQDHHIVRCPPNSARKNMIIGAVVGSICGAILLSCLIWWLVRRLRRNKRLQGTKETSVPSVQPTFKFFGKKDYKPLQDESEYHKQPIP